MAVTEDFGSFDPYGGQIFGLGYLAYDSLINMRNDGTVVSGLARKWSADARSASFVLHDDVTCSDGTPLRATDVANAINYVSDPKKKSLLYGLLTPTVPLTARGDDRTRTVKVVVERPFGFLLQTIGRLPIVCAKGLRDPKLLVIEGMLCAPDGAGPFPLIVHIHGGPVWAFRDTWSMNHPWVPFLVSRGYAVLSPNPRGSAGRGADFARRVAGDMGGGDARDIVAGVDALIEQGVADPARMALIGASYGGFLTSWLVTQDRRFAAAVPIAPITDWYSKCFTSNTAAFSRNYLGADPERPGTMFHSRSPVLHASKVRTPCLNVAGAQDLCTPPGQSQEFHQALQARGVESALVVYPEEGHGVRSYPAMTDFVTRVLLWFERHLGGAS